jgi:tetratricopeptide (TPR) repeat protein
MSQTDNIGEPLADIQNLLRAGDYAGARQRSQRWITDQPDAEDGYYFLAVSCRTLKAHGAAEQALQTLLENNPSHSRGLQEYGHLLRDRGELKAALGMYQRATRENPSLVASWAAQEAILRQQGNLANAQVAAVQVKWLKSLPQPLLVVMDLVSRGRLVAAEDLCKRFMRANPHHTEGMRLLADIALKLGATSEATLLLDTACELAPEDTRLKADRVNLLRRCQRFEDARQQALALVEQAPENPQFQSMAAVEAMQVGDYDDALTRFDQVLRMLPNDAITLTSRGHALKTCGKTDSAIDSYRDAIARQPGHGEAWYSLANLKTYRFEPADIEQMTTLAANPAVDAASRTYLHFALGKAFEDSEDWAQSFTHYAAGNRIKRRGSTYSAEQMHDDLALQAAYCGADLFADDRGRGCEAPDPIFIVGLPRAGSTLLEQILASHPMVDGTLELPNILAMAQSLRRRSEGPGYPQNLLELTAEERQTLGEQFIEETRIHRGSAPFFIDKMPNNFRHIGLIKLILPNAKIIDARRHPLACCFSGFKQLFAEGQEFSYDLSDLGRYYRDYVSLMDHWQQVLPGHILQVNNEDIIADLESQVRRLLDFLELPFDDRCLRYWETDRAIKTPSSEQVRRPVSDRGKYQWRHYEPWLGELKIALGPELTALSE